MGLQKRNCCIVAILAAAVVLTGIAPFPVPVSAAANNRTSLCKSTDDCPGIFERCCDRTCTYISGINGNNNLHCGGCNQPCTGVNQACFTGTCYTGVLLGGPCSSTGECAGPLNCCNGVCLDVLTNSTSCGSCGMACPEKATCIGGSCGVSCPASSTSSCYSDICCLDDPQSCCDSGVCCGGGCCSDSAYSCCGDQCCLGSCCNGQCCSSGSCCGDVCCTGHCCNGKCIRDDDKNNCGGCGNKCGFCKRCLSGNCVDVSGDCRVIGFSVGVPLLVLVIFLSIVILNLYDKLLKRPPVQVAGSQLLGSGQEGLGEAEASSQKVVRV